MEEGRGGKTPPKRSARRRISRGNRLRLWPQPWSWLRIFLPHYITHREPVAAPRTRTSHADVDIMIPVGGGSGRRHLAIISTMPQRRPPVVGGLFFFVAERLSFLLLMCFFVAESTSAWQTFSPCGPANGRQDLVPRCVAWGEISQ